MSPPVPVQSLLALVAAQPPLQSAYEPSGAIVMGSAAGAATIVIIWVIGLFHVAVPPEVASAFTVLLTAGAAYMGHGGRSAHTT